MKIIFGIFFTLFLLNNTYSQVELADVSNPVYDFFKRMQLKEIIPDYNSSDIPLSRSMTAGYLKTIKSNQNKLNSTDKKLLSDFETEFEFDMYGSLKNQYSLFGNKRAGNIFSEDNQKYLFSFTDSVKTFFSDIYGIVSNSGSDGDSTGKYHNTFSDYGFRIRGSLYGTVGYDLNVRAGRKLSGDTPENIYPGNNNPVFLNDPYYSVEKENYNTFTGYLRYQTKQEWLALTFGRSGIKNGFGYSDKLFLSDNTLPFDFGRINIRYKSIAYSFTYGSLRGDSAEVYPVYKLKPLDSKNIATHYLNVNFSDKFKAGFWEAVIISNQAFSFTYLNPISFLTSADLSTGKSNTEQNNSLMGIDLELTPVKNISLQSTLLIDDLTFGTLFKNDSLNENKFGWQIGLLWTAPVSADFAVEYTHLDPFVYSHRSNKSTYTNYTLPLGHSLPPNSDEIALKINYNLYSRLNLNISYKHQRSGEGIVVDSSGNLIANYGGNINYGEGDAYLRTNSFLDGTRINRDIITSMLIWEPVKQYFIEGYFQYRITDNVTYNKTFYDRSYFIKLKIGI